MAAKDTNGFWHTASIVLGLAILPFLAYALWSIWVIQHASFHPVPPDHIVPMQVCSYSGRSCGPHVEVYVTPLQHKLLLGEVWIAVTGAGVFLAFSAARIQANKGRLRVLARVQMISTKNGGRSQAVATGYRSNCSFLGASGLISRIGRFELEDDHWVWPGDTAEIVVSFQNGTELAKILQPGRKWSIHDGSKLVGHGEVLYVLTTAAFGAQQPPRW